MVKLLAVIILFLVLAWPLPARAGCGREPGLSPSQYRTLLMAQRLLETNRRSGALDLLPPLAQTSHHRTAFLRGRVLHGLGRRAEAAQAFTRSVRLWPCFASAWRNLAVTQHEMGKPLSAAESAAQGYSQVKPREPGLAYLAGVFYLSARRPEQALSWLERLAGRPQAKPAWLWALAQAYQDLGKLRRARLVIRRLIDMSPGESRFWRLAARVEVGLKNYAAAAAALETALRLAAPQAGDLRDLAELFRAAGVIQKSARYLRISFGPRPSPGGWLLLAQVYLQGNYLDQAAGAARRAEEGGGGSRAHALVGEISWRQREYSAALKAFSQAARMTRGGPAARNHMMVGYCALKLEKYLLACRSFAAALKAAPRGESLAKEAARALKTLQAFLRSHDLEGDGDFS